MCTNMGKHPVVGQQQGNELTGACATVRKQLHNRSEKCSYRIALSTRLLFVLVPGHLMGLEHEVFFKGKSDSLVQGYVTAHDCPSVYSYFSGVTATPCLPESVDSVFDHADRTLYFGRKELGIEKEIVKMPMPAYFWRRRRSQSERAELDALEGFIVDLSGNNSEVHFQDLRSANSTLFLLHLGGLDDSDASADVLYQIYSDIRMLVESIDLAYGNVGTNALLIGEESGPFALWGPDVRIPHDPGHPGIRIGASDVAPLVAGLLRIAVPHDSLGRLKKCLVSGRNHLSAYYCNALQLSSLVKDEIQGPLMEDLHVNTTMMLSWAKTLVDFEPVRVAKNIISAMTRVLSCILAKVKYRRQIFRTCLAVSCCVAWTILLVVELTAEPAKTDRCPKLLRGAVHISFGLLSAAALVGSQLLLLPFWWSLYATFSVLSLWAAFASSNVLTAFFTAQWWKKIFTLVYYSTGCVVLAEYWWRSSQKELTSLIIGLCIFSQFPVLPRFYKSPRLAKCVWWFVCVSLVGCLFLPGPDPVDQQIGTQSKLFTFACTVWLCLAGVSAMHHVGRRDVALGAALTVLTGVALLAQSAARVPAYYDSLKYVTLPMMLTPFLPLLGSPKTTSRMAHVVFSSAAVVILTSTSYEPLTFLLAIASVALWTLMEQFRLEDESGVDRFRRSVFLAIAVSTTAAVSRSQRSASFIFGFPKFAPIFELYRRAVIATCIMTIYLTMVPSSRSAYSSYVILTIADAFATLRSVIFGSPVDGTTAFHVGSIALVVAYYAGRLLAPTSGRDKHDMGPPSQTELQERNSN